MKHLALVIAVLCGPESVADKEYAPLISTTWGQRDQYAEFTPGDARLGCWSVAFAQILYYHKLEPRGDVQYSGRNYKISQSMNQAFDWDLFADSIGPKTPSDTRREVAKYCYFTSIATRKDFFTNNYKGNSDIRRQAIESHFQCKTRRFRNYGERHHDLRNAIFDELRAKRPLLLFVKQKQNNGLAHALVIDGARERMGRTELHLNFGWNGQSNGWYELERPIVTKQATFDHPDWWVLAIEPSGLTKP